MTLDRSAPLDEQVEALLGTEARRWIKTLPSDRQEWLERCGPRQALPEWLLDMGPDGDFIPIADQIATFADSQLPAGIKERVKGAMGDSMYVVAAARLIPSARHLHDRLLPLLDNVWGALNDNDHTAVLLALPEIAGLAGQGRQMLDGIARPGVPGPKSGSVKKQQLRAPIIAIMREQLAAGHEQSSVIDELAPQLLRLPREAAAPDIRSAKAYLRSNAKT